MFVNLLISLIKTYQYIISPFTRQGCRFHPTCSEYAIHALQHHGLFRGTYLTLRRLFRCHPFHNQFGFDPVPQKKTLKQS